MIIILLFALLSEDYAILGKFAEGKLVIVYNIIMGEEIQFYYHVYDEYY